VTNCGQPTPVRSAVVLSEAKDLYFLHVQVLHFVQDDIM
jgi:hypothetical protein